MRSPIVGSNNPFDELDDDENSSVGGSDDDT